MSMVWKNIVGGNETENESDKSYCTLEQMTVLRAVRKEMGVPSNRVISSLEGKFVMFPLKL